MNEPYGFEAGRQDEANALRAVFTQFDELLLTSGWHSDWKRLLFAGIGASSAALASPLHYLRANGGEAYRTDCSDFPEVTGSHPDVVVAVSQSGRSRETADLVRQFAGTGTHTLAVTNNEDNPLLQVAENRLTLGGHQDSRVSTVGFVVTFAALGMLTDFVATGHVDARWVKLPDAIEAAVGAARPVLDEFAAESLATGVVDVVANAPQLTTAEAVALLFREGPLIPATSYGTRAYLHGPMDCAGQDTSHLLIGGARELQLAEQLSDKTSRILAVTDGLIAVPRGLRHVAVPAGFTGPQRALIEVCVLQGLVSGAARIRGTSVDEVEFIRQDTKVDTLTQL